MSNQEVDMDLIKVASKIVHNIHMRPVCNDDNGEYDMVGDIAQIEDIVYKQLVTFKKRIIKQINKIEQ